MVLFLQHHPRGFDLGRDQHAHLQTEPLQAIVGDDGGDPMPADGQQFHGARFAQNLRCAQLFGNSAGLGTFVEFASYKAGMAAG